MAPASRAAKSRPSLLITGAKGGLASIVTHLLEPKFNLVGVDPRPLSRVSFPGKFYQIHYTSREMTEVFRSHRFRGVVHMGRIRLNSQTGESFRFQQNVLGTRNILELCRKNSVKKVVVISSFHVYGAHPTNHVHIREDEPLRASQSFPELVDAVELDHAATNFLWRHRDVQTVVLRPSNVIGGKINNAVSTFLRAGICPKLTGFDPLLQFIHEQDFARCIHLALEANQSGIYNVSGEGAVPYSKAIELAEAVPVSIPSFLAYPVAKLLRMTNRYFPKHLIDYFKYPTILSDKSFQKDFGYEPWISTVDALKSLKKGRSGKLEKDVIQKKPPATSHERGKSNSLPSSSSPPDP